MPAIKIPRGDLLAGIKPGVWVAISPDQDRVIATGKTVDEVIRKVREAGEEEPFFIRVPEKGSALIF
jgi:hypothetical protein